MCLLLHSAACLPHALAQSSEVPDEIILRVDADEGVTLHGATLGKMTGKTEDLIRSEPLVDEPVAKVGKARELTDVESRVEFQPNVPRDGDYDVYIRWLFAGFWAGLSDAIPVRVETESETAEYAFGMNRGNAWVFLGTFPLQAGKSLKVTMDAEGVIGAGNVNAIKLVPASNPPTEGKRNLPVGPDPQDEFDKMRVHAAVLFTPAVDADINDPMLRNDVRSEMANAYLDWKTLRKGEGIEDLWSDLRVQKPIELNEGGGGALTGHFQRISNLAAAYVGSNAPLGFASKMQGNPELRADILYAMEWMNQNRYNDRSINKLGAEWIGMEIINPLHIAKTLLLLHPNVPQDLIDKQMTAIEAISPGPEKEYRDMVSTGFNRLFATYAFVLRSIVIKDVSAMDRINTLIEGEYQINNRSTPITGPGGKAKLDGYYSDGSFIQHHYFPYIGIYGRGLLGLYADLTTLLAGSPWEIDDPRSKVFYDWVYRGYAPLFFGGEIMYGSLGRSTGQSWHQNGRVSTEIMDALVRLVDGAPPEDKARLSTIFKGWMDDRENSAYPEFSAIFRDKVSWERLSQLKEIQADETLVPERPQAGTTVFHNTDYVVHHQPDFAVQLRMFSTRIKTHEDINEGTNRLGWYQGEGTLFLYNRDNSRYHDNFWATVNPYRLPGITVDPRPRETPGSKNGELSTSPWAGGVQLNGFGMASMGLAAVDVSLTAQKAWFFFGDQIVCLGNEIRSTDNRPIETIVENVKLHGESDYTFVINGQPQPKELGWSADLKEVSWAHLAGKVPGTDVGWWFPGGAELKALREARTGNWRESFKSDVETGEFTRNYFTLWYDHGPNPSGATYAYVLLPGRSIAETKAYAAKPGVEIIENTAAAQSVKAPAMGITGANFWADAAHTSGDISSTGKAAVLVLEKDDKLCVAVSDPTQLGTNVEITLQANASKELKLDEGIRVLSLRPLKLSINLEKSDGKTFLAEFQK